MHRTSVFTGILGMIVAAGAAHAAVPSTVKLFGQTYNVEAHSLGGTYKNGLKVSLAQDITDRVANRKAALFFAPGETQDKDELYVASAINASDDTGTADQLYRLTGTDATGTFNQTNSSLTQFFGGNVSFSVGGRPTNVMLINRDDTGKKKDRNIVVTTLDGDDHYRFYDLDSMVADYQSEVVFEKIQRAINPDEGDPAAPWGAFVGFAPGPNGTIVALGRGGETNAEIGVMDPKKDAFFNVLSPVADVFTDKDQPDVNVSYPHAVAEYSGTEYWMLTSNPQVDGNGTDDRLSNLLVRLKVTFPADLSKGEPGSIKTEILGQEELLPTGLGGTPDGIMGLAIGRETSAGSGKHIVYMADWSGMLLTLTPQ